MPKRVKINWQEQIFTISDQKFSLQAYYLTPIKQIWQYLQQYQKYELKSALLSINLRNHQFEQLYREIRDQVQQKYEEMLEKTMQIIHDLLITTQLFRVFRLKYHVSLIEAFRSTILRKDCDPYGFNIKQFSQDFSKVKEYLKNYQQIREKQQLIKAKQQIRHYTQRIKQVQTKMIKEVQKCRVIQPYLAQNSMHQVVDTGPLFKEYLKLINYEQQRFSQTCIRKSFKLRQAVLQQGNAFIQQIIKSCKTCINLAREYNSNIYNYSKCIGAQQNEGQRVKHKNVKNVIRQSTYRQSYRKLIDTEQLNEQGIDRQPPAALKNRILNVKFKGTVRVSNIETNEEQLLQMVDNPQKQKNHQQFQYKYPHENLIKRNYQSQRQKYFEKKMREEQSDDQFINHFNSKKKKKQPYNHRQMRELMNSVRTPQFNKGLNWLEVCQSSNIFSYWLKKIEEAAQVTKIRQSKNQQNEESLTSYKFQKKQKNIKKSEYYNLKEDSKSAQKQNKNNLKAQQARLHENQLYQQLQKQQYKRKMIKLKNLLNTRTYESFAKMNKLQQRIFKSQTEFQRYGIRLFKKLKDNSLADLKKFFSFYFKQRFYREHEKVQQANQNPIKFNDQTIDKLLTNANVSRLNSFTKDKPIFQYKMFIIWGQDLIHFELKKSLTQTWNYFEFICYTPPLNAQKLLYQLRKSSERPFQENIVTQYYQCQNNQTQVDPMKKLFSFIENMHRILYDRHKRTINLEESSRKGQQIAEQIIQDILSQTPKQ